MKILEYYKVLVTCNCTLFKLLKHTLLAMFLILVTIIGGPFINFGGTSGPQLPSYSTEMSKHSMI